MAEEDVIFGKLRHLYGGIEPANMNRFEARVVDNHIQLICELPADTMIDGTILCSVKGAVIRRKKDWYPENEFDGDLIFDIKNDGTYTDLTAVEEEFNSYYYAAFPYSTQGVFNRSDENRSAIFLVAKALFFRADYTKLLNTDPFVNVSYAVPNTVAGISIISSIEASPEVLPETPPVEELNDIWMYENPNYESGGNNEGVWRDHFGLTPDDTSKVCYYTIFPYSYDSNGDIHYNYDPDNRTSTILSDDYHFGFDIDLENSNPNTRVSYPSDVDNFNYDGVSPLKDSYNTYSGWPYLTGSPIGLFFPKPCILNNDGTVDRYLDSNDYEVDIEGNSIDLIGLPANKQVMMEWPLIYTKRWTDKDEDGNPRVYHFRCSNRKLDDDYYCWTNYREDGSVADHFYTAAYYTQLKYDESEESVRYVSGLVSTNNSFGSHVYTSGVESLGEKYGRALSEDFPSGWRFDTLSDRMLIWDLLILLGKTTNIPYAFGTGYAPSTGSNLYNIGSFRKKGLFFDPISGNYYSSNKVFGMENYWAMYQSYTDGLFIDKADYVFKVKGCLGMTDGSTVSDYNDTGDGYLEISALDQDGEVVDDYLISVDWSYNWTDSLSLVTPFMRLPLSGGNGSSTTYDCIGTNPNNAGYHDLTKQNFIGSTSNTKGPVSICPVNSTSTYRILYRLSYR